MPASPHFAPSGFQVPLTHGDHQAVVVEVGGGIRTYRLAAWDVLDGYDASEMCTGGRGQTLVPWPNRVRDGRYAFAGAEHQLPLDEPERGNAIHGLVRWAPWRAADGEESWVRMEHVLHPQPGYPWTLQLAVEHRLDHDGLTVTTTARNAGSEPCPYAAGAHPYLSVGTPLIDDALLTVPAATRLVVDERGIPTGREAVAGTPYDFRSPRPIGDLQLDTPYADLTRDGDGWATAVVESPDGRRRVELAVDAGHRDLMVFTGDTLPEPGRRRRSVAVEPMTCPPNAFQTGEDLAVLAPGDERTTRWRITPYVVR